MLQILFLPFLAALILTGIHAYLGIHVIERKVIFVDLALAQIASLGALVAVIFGFHLHTLGSYFFSLGFALLGAALFAFTRLKEKLISQEVIIGISYAVCSALSILVLNGLPSEAEHIKEMLVGNLLFVHWQAVLKIAILYSVIGVVHFLFRRQFLAISLDPDHTSKNKTSVRWWDFLFYATFGVVVTSSVEIAGVFLVFAYLIIPATCAILLATTIRGRLILGWVIGVVGSLGGFIASALWDFPTGAAIVVVFGLMLILIALIRFLVKKISGEHNPTESR
jgi:zinc/manganese transport system permease protein